MPGCCAPDWAPPATPRSGAGASLGGQGAEALLPENSPYRPLANIAGQMLGGGLVAGGMGLGKAAINTGVDQAREMLGLMLPSRAEGIAANRLAAAASDPAAVARALSEARPAASGTAARAF